MERVIIDGSNSDVELENEVFINKSQDKICALKGSDYSYVVSIDGEATVFFSPKSFLSTEEDGVSKHSEDDKFLEPFPQCEDGYVHVPKLRKSLSTNCLILSNEVSRKVDNLGNELRKLNISSQSEALQHGHKTSTVSSSNDAINRLASHKIRQSVYVTQAEAINKFFSIPDRFHSLSRNDKYIPSSSRVKAGMKRPTIPQSPNLSTKRRIRSSEDKKQPEEFYKPKPKINVSEPVNHNVSKILLVTKPVPFTFEKRDKEAVERREKRIKQVMEEERKARIFHATPISKSVQNLFVKPNKGVDNNVKSSNKFRKPCAPKPVTEFMEFEFALDRRAEEHKKLKMQRLEKERELAELERIRQEQRLHEENEIIAELRKKTEHKAKPVPNYKEFKLVYSPKITLPETPKLLKTVQRTNKENNPNTSNKQG